METRFHYIQHVPFEGPGVILPWALKQGFRITATHVWKEEKYPSLSSFDWLLILGGPMSIHDEKEFPWLIKEKELIKKAAESGKKVIGICLGAQLIASALGAEVSLNRVREVGWYPLAETAKGKASPFKGILDGLTAFHWHGETFTIPDKAVHLCKSEGCINQGFSIGNNILALQFHLETDDIILRGMVKELEQEKMSGGFVMDPPVIMEHRNYLHRNQEAMIRLLEILNRH